MQFIEIVQFILETNCLDPHANFTTGFEPITESDRGSDSTLFSDIVNNYVFIIVLLRILLTIEKTQIST